MSEDRVVTSNWKDMIIKGSENTNSQTGMGLGDSKTLLCSSLDFQRPKDRKCFSKSWRKAGVSKEKSDGS